MPGKVKVKILAGRNLPVMDRAGDTTDAFVEIKFGGVTHKTDICKKSLNPHWNSAEWYRFEVDESELQDEPLQLRLLDHDTYSANDTIGKVVISLSPLISRDPNTHSKYSSAGSVMSGWVPVFDTMHGLRGELNIIVKVELFSDCNKYKTSSCGVQFFHCPVVPPGYKVTTIHGFVEELVVNDDPEYQWIDKIRTPRASNEARQTTFIKLSNQVQRLVGVKAADFGANAVIGYNQAFDMEGEAGVVARAIGTAVTIEKIPVAAQPINVPVCNQHQLKKYLDILTTDNENITDLNEYFQTHQEELQKLMHILHPKLSPNFLEEDDDNDSIKLSFKTDSLSQEEYQQNIRHVIDEQEDRNKYLYCNDRDEEESASSMKKIKKFRSNFFSKRFGSHRSKITDKDTISIKSNSSDASRISLAEIKNEFKRFKRLRKPKFRASKTSEEGVGMASILARSVIHVHSSLARIAETLDSEHSPCSTLRRTSESEPTVHKSDEEKIEPPVAINIEETNTNKVLPQSHFSSLKNLNTELKVQHRKMSISCPNTPYLGRKHLLKLPGEEGYYGSLSSALSGESSDIYSSSEDDDDSSDLRTESEKIIETPHSIAQFVLKQELQSAALSKIEKKFEDLECEDILKIENSQDIMPKHSSEGDVRVLAELPKMQELKLPEDNLNAGPSTAPIPTNSHNHYFKFHNPFSHKKSSFSEPSSPTDKKSTSFLPTTRNIVFRSSKSLKAQLAKFTNNSKIKSLSHYSLLPKKKNADTKPIHHSSATEIGPKRHSRETVLGSPFMSYSDLLSLDKDHDLKKTLTHDERSPVRMYIGSEPVSRMSSSCPSSPKSLDFIDHDTKPHTKEKSAIKPTGLLHTAMETILLDKVQSLLIPATPDVVNKEERKFFNDVNEKLGKVEEMRKVQDNIEVNSDNQDKLGKVEERPKGQDNVEVNREIYKKLVRQNSIHSSLENLAPKTLSKEKKEPVLQHFHPIMSGPIHPKLSHLETIPSLPETSFDREFSIDSQSELDSTQSLCENLVPKIELTNVGNSVVCDNTHAVCGGNFPRNKGTEKGSPRHSRQENGPSSAGNNVNTPPVGFFRRSSDSDASLTHKGSYPIGGAVLKSSMHPNNIDMLEYPFLTLSEYPIGFVKHIAGSVFARSVKLIDGDADVTTRTAWWTELRTELRSHARALKCNSVISYSEGVSICEDVCILSVSGTAAIINLECDFSAEQNEGTKSCSLTHLNANVPQYNSSVCGICGNNYVCNVLFATCNLPQFLDAHSVANTITAAASRARRNPQGEAGARDLSDQLPFLEYELHKLLLAKLRMQGANSIFNLHTQVTIGERFVTALASGTAVKLLALPSPTAPQIKATEGDKAAAELQKCLSETFVINKASSGYDTDPSEPKVNGFSPTKSTVESTPLDLCSDKDACVLEIDETEDVETAKALCIRRRPLPILNSNSDIKPKLDANPHAFIQVWRGKYMTGTTMAEKSVSRVLDGVYFKLRTMRPCALSPIRFQLDYAEEDIQLLITGAAIPLLEPYGGPENGTRIKKASSLSQSIAKNMGRINKQHIIKHIDNDDIIFDFEDDRLLPHIPDKQPHPSELKQKYVKIRPPSIALTPLPYIHGATRQTWICALRLLFVRETTSVKELGGLNGFLHSTMSEVLAIVRAYTFALGGNTLTSFFITQLMIENNAHKNQGQCIFSVGGDVIHVSH